MITPSPAVAEAIELSCRTHMHAAGQAVKDAVRAHCDRDFAAARRLLAEAATSLHYAERFCPEPAPEKPAAVQGILL